MGLRCNGMLQKGHYDAERRRTHTHRLTRTRIGWKRKRVYVCVCVVPWTYANPFDNEEARHTHTHTQANRQASNRRTTRNNCSKMQILFWKQVSKSMLRYYVWTGFAKDQDQAVLVISFNTKFTLNRPKRHQLSARIPLPKDAILPGPLSAAFPTIWRY